MSQIYKSIQGKILTGYSTKKIKVKKKKQLSASDWALRKWIKINIKTNILLDTYRWNIKEDREYTYVYDRTKGSRLDTVYISEMYIATVKTCNILEDRIENHNAVELEFKIINKTKCGYGKLKLNNTHLKDKNCMQTIQTYINGLKSIEKGSIIKDCKIQKREF
ncbi:hypothetical protein CHS0354_020532 [Potamilus streckersoni]|uniref:Uncharacterized protein n=1 Tax=Potamilus streckersoni TaxID=2493646 RepID=A0AAE0W0W4_9BIVA|nr:hypothetical protein CHS0354_020532 [Potamilus streckersoni]